MWGFPGLRAALLCHASVSFVLSSECFALSVVIVSAASWLTVNVPAQKRTKQAQTWCNAQLILKVDQDGRHIALTHLKFAEGIFSDVSAVN